MAAQQEQWFLSEEQRIDSLARAFSSLCSLQFSSADGASPHQQDNWKVAKTLETKAYATAEAQAVTTTGARPKSEVTRAYARKLGELICEAAQAKSTVLEASKGTAPGHSQITLDISGTREFLTKSAAEDLLSKLFEEPTCIERIVFSMKSFATDAAEVAAKGLRKISTTLKHADISDTIAGRPEAEALQALGVLCEALSHAELISLDLSDNALGEKGIRACKSVIEAQTSLQSLSLRNVGCSDKACEAVDAFLSTSNLRSLFLCNNMSGDAGASFISKIIGRAPLLCEFQMASSRVQADGALALCNGLRTGSCLVDLDLSDNPLTEEAAEGLASVISHHPLLRVLNLNDTCLTDVGVGKISSALAEGAPELEVLELALNEVTATGANHIGLAISNKPKLKRLNLRENELEDDGTSIVATSLEQNTSLEELDLVMNMIGKTGAMSVAKVLSNKPHFKRLELAENQISEEGVEELQELLSQMFPEPGVLGSLDENDPGSS